MSKEKNIKTIPKLHDGFFEIKFQKNIKIDSNYKICWWENYYYLLKLIDDEWEIISQCYLNRWCVYRFYKKIKNLKWS